MCGLVGFLNPNSRLVNLDEIIRVMTAAITHRGPDDQGIYHADEGIALGHQRLSILDLSEQGHQPMHSACSRYVMVYNGEIYNYLELKEQLIQNGQRFNSHSDTEVILALVTRYGLFETLLKLTGMFALAIWDKAEKVLHLARDRIGEKPLYYGLVNGALVFGSELKALRLYPNFNNSISRQSVSLLTQYGYIPSPHSIYENIFKLQPGMYLTIPMMNMNQPFQPKPYWSAKQVALAGLENPLSLSDDAAIEKMDTVLSEIVKARMVADVPVGAFLSGGVDSSLIVSLMQKCSDRPVKTFTIGFEEKNYNEAIYAKNIANHLQTEHTELYVTSQQTLDVIPRLPEIYDEPFADSSAIPTFLVSEMTSRAVKVCLTGDGGDEIFCGYNRYLFGNDFWDKITRIPYPMRSVLEKILVKVSPKHWDSMLSFMKVPSSGEKVHKFASVIAARSPEIFYQRLISQWANPHDVVVQGAHEHNQKNNFLHSWENMSSVENMMLCDTMSFLPDDIMVKVDRAGMAVSLESRAPYLDHHLIELMWKMPFNMKIRNRETKWLLRKILGKYVPNSLIERPKMGFGVPLDTWLRGPLRDWAESLLDPSLLKQAGFFQVEPIRQKWEQHLSGKRNCQHSLWQILMFQAWLQKNN